MSTGSHVRIVHLGRQLPLRRLVSSAEAGRYPVGQSANGKIHFLPCLRLEFLQNKVTLGILHLDTFAPEFQLPLNFNFLDIFPLGTPKEVKLMSLAEEQ